MTERSEQQPVAKGPLVQSCADEMKHTLVVAAEQMAEVTKHAVAAYPEECCGILIGLPGEAAVVHSLHAAENRRTARPRDRYEVDPREILKLDRAAESEGREILGFYHSHPDHPARPSPTDAKYAWPGYVYLIVGATESGETEVRAWRYDDKLSRFRECRIEPDDTHVPLRR